MEIKLSWERVGQEEKVFLYRVELVEQTYEGESVEWVEEFGSRHECALFLEGVKAGLAMKGKYIALPYIPNPPSIPFLDS